jgi:hypothetical protein
MPIWRQPPQPQQITVHTPIIIVGGEVYELSCTDGLMAGDTPITQCSFGVSCVDGLTGGDASGNIASLYNTLLDGAKLSDSVTHFLALYLSLTDGAKLSDSTILDRLKVIRALLKLYARAIESDLNQRSLIIRMKGK